MFVTRTDGPGHRLRSQRTAPSTAAWLKKWGIVFRIGGRIMTLAGILRILVLTSLGGGPNRALQLTSAPPWFPARRILVGVLLGVGVSGILVACSNVAIPPTYTQAEFKAICERRGGWWHDDDLMGGFCEKAWQ